MNECSACSSNFFAGDEWLYYLGCADIVVLDPVTTLLPMLGDTMMVLT